MCFNGFFYNTYFFYWLSRFDVVNREKKENYAKTHWWDWKGWNYNIRKYEQVESYMISIWFLFSQHESSCGKDCQTLIRYILRRGRWMISKSLNKSQFRYSSDDHRHNDGDDRHCKLSSLIKNLATPSTQFFFFLYKFKFVFKIISDIIFLFFFFLKLNCRLFLIFVGKI